MTEDFMALTLDVWEIPPESARRVGHPAPFPVELPEQLVRLYTFENDLVLDPFMGSGSTLVAAAQLARRYVGYDLDPTYVEIARGRVEAITAAAPPRQAPKLDPLAPTPVSVAQDDDEDFQSRATREGKAAQRLAEDLLIKAGFRDLERNRRIPKTGVTVNFVATDANGEVWYFDVSGAFKTHRGGLLRTDTVWKSLGRANALRSHVRSGTPLVFLTTNLPRRPSEGDTALRSAGPDAFFDAIEMLSVDDLDRLAIYAKGGMRGSPRLGFWTAADLDRRST
jgi:site-specific DNA-methyltransferase (adenine-specific)